MKVYIYSCIVKNHLSYNDTFVYGLLYYGFISNRNLGPLSRLVCRCLYSRNISIFSCMLYLSYLSTHELGSHSYCIQSKIKPFL